MHVRRLRTYQKTGKCELCLAVERTQWSNKSGEYRAYDDEYDWQELCVLCHTIYDKDARDKSPIPYVSDLRRELNKTAILFGSREQALGRLKTYNWYY